MTSNGETKVFKCECMDPFHHIEVQPFDREYNEFLIYFACTDYNSFWKRLRMSFKYLFFREKIIAADILLSRKTAVDFAQHLLNQTNHRTWRI